MLWLTGFLGVCVVGAVAFLDLSPAEEDDGHDASELDDFIDENGMGVAGAQTFDAAQGTSEAVLNPLTVTGTGMEHAVSEQIGADHIAQFDPSEEDLVLVWDDSEGEEPEVHLSPAKDDPSVLELTLGGDVMAQVPVTSGLTIENVALLPLSAAQALGWMDADTGAAADPTEMT